MHILTYMYTILKLALNVCFTIYVTEQDRVGSRDVVDNKSLALYQES